MKKSLTVEEREKDSDAVNDSFEKIILGDSDEGSEFMDSRYHH
jgi:hypothetical protein